MLNPKDIRVCELFSGIGGFRKGLELSSQRYNIIWSNDNDKYAAGIYRYHWNDGTMHEGDIRAVDPKTIPEHDLIVGGFPCQSFSIAGKRGGFEDTRGTLFFEICRIARACGTQYLLLENVKGLLNHDKGNTFQTIIRTLDELGYGYQWQVLNSKNFGVPQKRERVFLIGNLRGEPRPQVFPITESNRMDYAFPTVSSGYAKRRGEDGVFIKITQEEPRLIHTAYPGGVREYMELSPTISTPSGGGHLPMVAIPILTPDRPTGRQNGRKFKTDGEPMFTLTGMDKHGVILNSSIRRLTPMECERLQGFPDNWTTKGIINDKEVLISDSQRYKCCGNAVTTNVITEIGKAFLRAIK